MRAGHDVAIHSFACSGHETPRNTPLFAAPETGGVTNPTNQSDFARHLERFSADIVINQMPYDHMTGERIREFGQAASLGCLRNTLFSVRNNLDNFVRNKTPRMFHWLTLNGVGRAAFLALHRHRHAVDLRRILATYDRFVLFAPPNEAELAYFVPDYDPAKIALIPNSIPSVAVTIPEKQKRILWLARVAVHQKRADLVLPVWRCIAKALPDWTLDIVGDGPYLSEMRASAARQDVPRVIFHGRQPSKPFFERAAIFLMTSDFEGFPNTLIEAQSQGAVPVAVDSYPMVNALIDDGSNGVSVPQGDMTAFANAVIGLGHADARRASMAHAALRSAAEYTEARVVTRWQALLEEVQRERITRGSARSGLAVRS